jgi:hypothetical protein
MPAHMTFQHLPGNAKVTSSICDSEAIRLDAPIARMRLSLGYCFRLELDMLARRRLSFAWSWKLELEIGVGNWSWKLELEIGVGNSLE